MEWRRLCFIPDGAHRYSTTESELERQINSGFYERLLLSNDKKSVLEVARKERQPESRIEIIKNPMILEFLGLKPIAT